MWIMGRTAVGVDGARAIHVIAVPQVLGIGAHARLINWCEERQRSGLAGTFSAKSLSLQMIEQRERTARGG